MQIPEYLFLWQYKIYTLFIFMAVGVLFSSFVVWFEGKRDGFDEEHLFDLFFLSIGVGLLTFFIVYRPLLNVNPGTVFVYVQYFWTLGFQIFGAFFLAMLPVYIFARMWKWSVFRILDIFAIAFCFGNTIPILGYILIYKRYEFFVILSGLVLMYLIGTHLRVARLNSGIIFSLFLLVASALGFLFLRNLENLIFYGILIVASAGNIYARKKSSMSKVNLPQNLINFVQQTLLKKRKNLKAEQKLLESEDPYLNPGRAQDNAENIDEAILEDGRKEVVDVRQDAISGTLVLIRKALAKIRIGNYGTCEICGKLIDPARLKAYPEATTCLDCVNKQKV